MEPGISEDIVGVVRKALEELGFDLAKAAAAPVGNVVPGSAADALFDRAAEYLLDDALGLSLAARIPIGSLGPIDYGLCTSATLRDALRLVTRYYGVATQRARLELLEDATPVRLVFHRLPNIAHSRHWVEFALAMIGTRLRQTIGGEPFSFARVAFEHPPPPRTDVHDEFFGTRVEFGAADDCLELDPALLDRPLLTASKALADLLERRMQELAPAMELTDPLLDRVRRALVTLLDEGITDLDSVAAHLGESRRTLQRALSERQTSHSALLGELRRERAGELLEAGLRVEDVAKRLGFGDASAFFRAYRRWTGTSPRGRNAAAKGEGDELDDDERDDK